MPETAKEFTASPDQYEGAKVADDLASMLEETGGVVEKKENIDVLVEKALETEKKVESTIPAESSSTVSTEPVTPNVEERKTETTTSEESPTVDPNSVEGQLAQAMEQNRQLLALLNNGSVKLDAAPAVDVPKAEVPKVDAEEIKERAKVVEDYQKALADLQKQQDLDDDTFEEVRTDKVKFKEYLDRRDALVEQKALQRLPEVVTHILDTRMTVSQFFASDDNKDLHEVSQFVARTAVQFQNDNPKLSNLDALKKAAEFTRSQLKIKQNGGNKPTAKPVFANPSTVSRPETSIKSGNPIADELDEMDKIISRR